MLIEIFRWDDAGREEALTPLTDEAAAFAPATLQAFEFTDYGVRAAGADRLLVGAKWVTPRGGIFPLRFENQLGLAKLQAFAGGYPHGDPLYVEVLSHKFSTLPQHQALLSALLSALIQQIATLPFAAAADTARGVEGTAQPATPLFTLHFLLQHGEALRAALATVLAAPHRVLADEEDVVPLAEASDIDGDVLLSILQTPQELAHAPHVAVARQMCGYAPQRIRQHLPIETANTPENRFVLLFVEQLIAAAEALPAQRWWVGLREVYRERIVELTVSLRETANHPLFDTVGRMHSLPASSRVLTRRSGYRELRALWPLFQSAFAPLFGPLQQAIDLRDVATLYEFWCFFALAKQIGARYDAQPIIRYARKDVETLGENSVAVIGSHGTLAFNRSFSRLNSTHRSYGAALRPDFVWSPRDPEQTSIAFDAKFRFDGKHVEQAEETAESDDRTAKNDDITKMHAYRDALALRAAVVLYPGAKARFYQTNRQQREKLSIADVLNGELHGVGMIPLNPEDAAEAP